MPNFFTTRQNLIDPDLRFDLPVFRDIQARLARLRDGKAYLARSDFLPEDLHPWLPHVVLVDVVDGQSGRDYLIRLVGTEIVRMFGFDQTGHHLSDYGADAWAERSRWLADWISIHERPVRTKLEMSRDPDGQLSMEALFVPLAKATRSVDQILGFLFFTLSKAGLRPNDFQEEFRR